MIGQITALVAIANDDDCPEDVRRTLLGAIETLAARHRLAESYARFLESVDEALRGQKEGTA